MTLRRSLVAAALCAAGIGAAAAHPPYEPAPVAVAADASYRLADGTVAIVGERTLEPLLLRWNALFTRAHPAIRFTLRLGDSPVGLDGIIARVSLLAPIAHDAWESEVDPFKRLNGYRPLDIRIGSVGHAGPGRTNPPGVYVNAANPLVSLRLAEVGRVFTTGMMPSDLRRWSQLNTGSLAGEWAKHAIHAYGTRDDGNTVTTRRLMHFDGRPFARHYEALETDADVLAAVAGDRWGIGLAGPVAAARVPAGVRFVPLARRAGDVPSAGGYDDVREGRYPLAPALQIHLDCPPANACDPLAREYVRLVLSREGQQAIADARDESAGFVPLSETAAAAERARLR